ncbi:MAG: hypothetical protein HDS97_05705 [Bacteroidales bacterium]|nr:hypothetical protein [Bacteroidales bacterium]
MITIIKSPSFPVFSTITHDSRYKKITPIVNLTPVGKIIYECLDTLCMDFPSLKILRRIAMPDHIHFELFVTAPTEKPLGSMIAAFKSQCTKESWMKYSEPNSELGKESMFSPGFNDKIAFQAGAKDAFYNYIADNPRRYLVKKLCPEYFYHKIMIEIEGKRYGLYGNIFLLDNPVKSFVKISRDKSKMPDLDEKMKGWEETIRCDGVLVSPFINPSEKEIRDKAIENGNGLIIIVNYRFSERAKPYKSLFDLCAEGRILIINTEEFSSPPKDMRYSEAQKLNGIASAVAKLPPLGAKLIPR